METKPGIKTTEFWTTVFSLGIGIIQMATGAVNLNDKWVAIAMAIVAGLYNASRGIAKQGISYTPAAPKVTTVVESETTPTSIQSNPNEPSV